MKTEFHVGQRVEFYKHDQGDLGTITAVREREHSCTAQVRWDDATDSSEIWFRDDEIRVVDTPDAVELVPYDGLPKPYDLLGATQTFMLRAKQLRTFGWEDDYAGDLRTFRRKLLEEEIKEWRDDGDQGNDPVEYADGLADIIVTAVGGLFAFFGPEVTSEILQEVGVTNLDKVRPGNIRLREGDNKVLKPEDWIGPPDIKGILERAGVIKPVVEMRHSPTPQEMHAEPVHDDDREAGWG